MNDPRGGTLQRLAILTCLLAAAPSAAAAQAAQACEMGAISEITFDRQKPFLPEATAEDASAGWLFRGMNSIHIRTTEQTIRWELLFEEGDCLDPILLRESERNLRSLAYIAEARVRSDQLADGSHRVSVMTLDGWALVVGIGIEIEEEFRFTGISVTAKNIVGTGTTVGYFRSTFRERERVGGLARQPNLFGTRIDATLQGGNTRSGSFFSESLFRPFSGEVGKNAFRQVVRRQADQGRRPQERPRRRRVAAARQVNAPGPRGLGDLRLATDLDQGAVALAERHQGPRQLEALVPGQVLLAHQQPAAAAGEGRRRNFFERRPGLVAVGNQQERQPRQRQDPDPMRPSCGLEGSA